MRAPVRYVEDGLVRYDWPDKEWLEHHYVTLGKTALEISKEVGCDGHAIALWLRKAGIRVRPRGENRRKYPELCDEEWLRHQYVTLGKSSGQIQRELDVPYGATVVQWLHKAGIKIRSPEERGKRHSKRMCGSGSPSWNGGTSQGHQKRALREADPNEICGWCGSTKNVQIHHIDHDRENGDLANLMWLCNYCNVMEASIYNLSVNGRVVAHRDGDTLILEFNRTIEGEQS